MVDLEIIYGFGCPLTVHRRCISPMFDICNKIAYNSKMINRTKLPDKKVDLFFEKSAWIDIPGKVRTRQMVKNKINNSWI